MQRVRAKQPVVQRAHGEARRFLFSIAPIRKFLHFLAGKKLYKSFGDELVFFGIGGAKLSRDVEQFLLDAKFPYAIGYGLTETAPLACGAVPSRVKLGSAGFPPPEIQIRVADINPTTLEGEVQVKGDNVMKGYYKDPEKTKEVMTDDGWFKTGDLGIMIKKRLYIRGRIKNMILGPSGENIYPEAIESIINEQDYVLESLVYSSNKKITARVHFDYDSIDEHFASQKLTESEIEKRIHKMLLSIKIEINNKVANFSRIQSIIEQQEPFEKTPTLKIKRYLYS